MRNYLKANDRCYWKGPVRSINTGVRQQIARILLKKMHRAQSWQDNLFLRVQSSLGCHSYDLRRERERSTNSPRAVSGSLCRQGSNRLQRECCLRREDRPGRRTGGIASTIMLPSTFGGPANPNISATSLNRWKKKCEIAGRPACKSNLRIPGKKTQNQGLHVLPRSLKRVIRVWQHKKTIKPTPKTAF